MLEIVFERQKRKVQVESGTNLREAAIANRVSIYPHVFKLLNCRGRGLCNVPNASAALRAATRRGRHRHHNRRSRR